MIPLKNIRKFNIDRTSFYKWQMRFEASGISKLADQPPIHCTHPQTTSNNTINKIIRLALDPCMYDSKDISGRLKDLYGVKLSYVTVN